MKDFKESVVLVPVTTRNVELARAVIQETKRIITPFYVDAARLATLACERPSKSGKRPDCICGPCSARRVIFGANIGVQRQEARRMALAMGMINDLTEDPK